MHGRWNIQKFSLFVFWRLLTMLCYVTLCTAYLMYLEVEVWVWSYALSYNVGWYVISSTAEYSDASIFRIEFLLHMRLHNVRTQQLRYVMYCIKMEKCIALPYSPQNICQTLLQLHQKLPDRWRSVLLLERSVIKLLG